MASSIMAAPLTFYDVPTEIVHDILLPKLSYRDVIALGQTSRQMHTLISDYLMRNRGLPNLARTDQRRLFITSPRREAIAEDYLRQLVFPIRRYSNNLPAGPLPLGSLLRASCLPKTVFVSLPRFASKIQNYWKMMHYSRDHSQIPTLSDCLKANGGDLALPQLQKLASQQHRSNPYQIEFVNYEALKDSWKTMHRELLGRSKRPAPGTYPQLPPLTAPISVIREFLFAPENDALCHRVKQLWYFRQETPVILHLPLEISRFCNLRILRLSGIDMDSYPRQFPHLPRLKELHLDHTGIMDFPSMLPEGSSPAFSPMPSLKRLVLQNNMLFSLAIFPYAPQTALFQLNLNQISGLARPLGTLTSERGKGTVYTFSRDFISVSRYGESRNIPEIAAYLRAQCEGQFPQLPRWPIANFYFFLMANVPQDPKEFSAPAPDIFLEQLNALPAKDKRSVYSDKFNYTDDPEKDSAQEIRFGFTHSAKESWDGSFRPGGLAQLYSATHKALLRETIEKYQAALNSPQVAAERERLHEPFTLPPNEEGAFASLVKISRTNLMHNLAKLVIALNQFETRTDAGSCEIQ